MMNVAVYRAVKPAARVMDNLRFPQKLLLMALIFIVPMLVVSAMLVENVSLEIVFNDLEVRGAAVMEPLADLQDAVQDHRGRLSLLLTHTDGKTDDIADVVARADAAIAKVDAWRAGQGKQFNGLDDKWKAIVSGWNDLKGRGAGDDADKNFDAHTQVINAIGDYIGGIADASNLTLDPEMTTYSLQDVVTAKVPVALQSIGALRNYTSTHIKNGAALEPATLGQIMTRETAMDIAFDGIAPELQKAMDKDKLVADAIGAAVKPAVDAKAALRSMVDDKVLASATVQAKSGEVFEAGGKAKEALVALNRRVIPELDRLLNARLAASLRSRTEAIIACAAAMLVGIYLFLGFVRSLNATLRGLRRASVRMTQNDFPEAIDLFSTDEMQEVADELEKVSHAFRRYSEDQRRQLIEASQRAAALSNASVGFMIANNDGIIEYYNESARKQFESAQEDLKARYPGFDPNGLVGKSFDFFHKNPEHNRSLIASLKSVYKVKVRIGRGVFELAVTPVFGEGGERLGSVVEWIDRTAQEAMDQKVTEIVHAAAAGDFTKRVDADGMEESFQLRARNLNQLLETVDEALQELDRVLAAVADGDLTKSITRQFGGQVGAIAQHTNATVGQLSQIVGQIKMAVDAVNTASREISQGNNDLSGRTEQQAAQIEETASSMEELTSAVKHNTESANQASQLARGASDVAVKGGTVVSQVVSNMGAIEESSRKVAEIVCVIDGIAFQTNILALNAAVEAARAGEQGRGFAVVASEVRSLAQRAAAAAKEIKELITDSVGKVEAGTQLVDSAGKTMSEIVNSIKRVTDIMNEISSASREQSSGIEQVNSAITHMDEVTQQNAALVEQASASARSLEEQAASLAAAISVFRTAGDARNKPAGAPTAAVRGAVTPRAKTIAPSPLSRQSAPVSTVTTLRPSRSATAAAPASMPVPREPVTAAAGGDKAWQEF